MGIFLVVLSVFLKNIPTRLLSGWKMGKYSIKLQANVLCYEKSCFLQQLRSFRNVDNKAEL